MKTSSLGHTKSATHINRAQLNIYMYIQFTAKEMKITKPEHRSRSS